MLRSSIFGMVLVLFFASESKRAQAAVYWVRLARLPSVEKARKQAALVQADWTKGGRLLRVMVQAGKSARADDAPGTGGNFFDVLVGPFDSLPSAIDASYRFQHEQPWRDRGFVLDSAPLVLSGAFVSAPVRFTSQLARACRAVHAGTIAQATETDAKTGNDTSGPTTPLVAEALVAKGFGYVLPRAYLPPAEQSSASFLAWDRLLVWDHREVCQKTPRVVGGPKPHVGPGPKDMTPQVHAAGKRCLEWLEALTPDMRLAWFPAEQLAVSARFGKTTLGTRWGPVRIRYALVRVGRSPKGILYQVVIRSGGFPPVRKTVVVADNYPPPHRLGFDRLGAALFEGRGLIVRRIPIKPPAPPVAVMWKMRRFKGYFRYEPGVSSPRIHPTPGR